MPSKARREMEDR